VIHDRRDSAPTRIGVFIASAAAWAVMLAYPEHACACMSKDGGATFLEALAFQPLGAVTKGWLLMLVAMMAPMTLPALYHIRTSSFARHRWSSSLLFLGGYAALWVAAGGVMKVVEVAARWHSPSSYLPAVVVAVAAIVWQASPTKQRCLNRCHAHTPLAAFGPARVRDATLMGLAHGCWCVGSCWALMLFPMLLPEGHNVAMMAVTVVMFCERLDPPGAPVWRLRGFQTAARWLRLRLVGPVGGRPPVTAPSGPARV
jgi:predicted metal-binding membrane protein